MPEIGPLHPALIYFTGALVVVLAPARVRGIVALATAVLGFGNALLLGREGVEPLTASLMDFELVLLRADAWSVLFSNIFALLSVVGIIYILHENSRLQFSAGLLYAGAGLGVVVAGDLISLFLFWEVLTLGAVLCLLARATEASGRAAFRYFVVHAFGGVVLLAGIVLHLADGGTSAFESIRLEGVGSYLIFIGVGINCAWPILGAWLTDTYPEASIGGVVFMATYTTKSAVYVLARAFPGEPALVWIGLIMAFVPLLYAVIAVDTRRVLAYCLINQVGFMVVGVGLGSVGGQYGQMALNGTAAHAYCHILYKALLFMAIGAVIYRTGRSKLTDFGGLWRRMPLTCAFCVIAAISISGFVSKSMILSSAAKQEMVWVWLILLFASAGVFLQAGLKLTYLTFFSRDAGIDCREAPPNMLLAMGITGLVSLFVLCFPNAFLYPMLPFQFADPVYDPHTLGHLVDQLSLMAFAGLAFFLLLKSGLYLAEIRSTNLDADWLYRRGGAWLGSFFDHSLNNLNADTKRGVLAIVNEIGHFTSAGPSRVLAWLLTPYWRVRGLDEEAIQEHRHHLYELSRRGAFPIGLTACLAVLLLAVLMVS